MDRLPVFKALGDNTRYAIYLELARAAGPLSTGEIADALDLHPNTVRPHLERMREAGLLTIDTDRQGQVGRPQHVYSLSAEAPSLGLEPSAFRLLARLLTGVAASGGPAPDDVAAIGRPYGASMTPKGCTSAVAAVRDGLAELGFDPAVGTDGSTTTVAFTRCPFQELASDYPDIVCHLHRGIVEGMVGACGNAVVTRFATIADRDPCEVDLVRR